MIGKNYLILSALQKFAQEFRDYKGEYAIIGGAACHLWFSDYQTFFRNTLDVDMALLLQSKSLPFVKAFLSFADRVGYQAESRLLQDGRVKRRLYRFRLARKADYPEMIEILGPDNEEIQRVFNQRSIPLKIDGEYCGLSCMLLDQHYYSLLRSSVTECQGVPVVSRETLIVLKIKAFLNIQALHQQDPVPPHGSDASMENAHKHRKDVIALLYLPGLRITPVDPSIRQDIENFTTPLLVEQAERDSLIRSVIATQSLHNIPLDSEMLTEMMQELLTLFPVKS